MRTLTVQPGGLSALTIETRATPTPKAKQVLVRWRATSLNYHDLLVANGSIPVPAGRIPMSDGEGEVVAVGEEVTQWSVGDKVMSMFFPLWHDGKPSSQTTRAISGETIDGCACEYGLQPEDSITRIPVGYTFAQAATLPCAALTAWRALMVEGNLQLGDKVLIEGSGGMSIFGLQLALAAGAEVYATSSSAAKAERLKALGASEVLNYRTDERWGKTLFKMTGGVDHVLDVGGGSTMVQSIEAAAMNGHIASIGILGDGRKGSITFPKLFFKHLRLTGLAVGSRRMQEDMIKAIELSGLQPVIDRSFALEELAEAFAYQAAGKHFGKIVVAW